LNFISGNIMNIRFIRINGRKNITNFFFNFIFIKYKIAKNSIKITIAAFFSADKKTKIKEIKLKIKNNLIKFFW
mgnify:CR=1